MENGRLQVVGRGKARRADGSLLGIFPIIVRRYERPAAIVQLQGWIR